MQVSLEMKSPRTLIKSNVSFPALVSSGWVGVARGVGVFKRDGAGLSGGERVDGVGGGGGSRSKSLSDDDNWAGDPGASPGSVSVAEGAEISAEFGCNAGEPGLCGVLTPRGREYGGSVGTGLPLEEVSAAVSILVVVGAIMSVRWGVVIEIKETAPCKDRFFFSSSPVGYGG